MAQSAPWSTTDQVYSQAVQYHVSGQRPQARRMYDQVLRVDQTHAGAWHMKGILAFEDGLHAEAVECLEKSANLENSNPRFSRNLGVAFRAMNRLSEAEAALRRSLELEPENAEVTAELGAILLEQKRYQEAIQVLHEALDRNPKLAAAWLALGEAFELSGDPYSGLACFHQGVSCDEENPIGYAQVGRLLFRLGYVEEAVVSFRWSLHLASNPVVHSRLLLAMTYQSECTAEEFQRERDAWNSLYGVSRDQIASHQNSREPNRKLRIAYVASSLERHPVSRFLEPVLASHDREKFEAFVYSHDTNSSPTTNRMRNYVSNWRALEDLDDDALELQMRDDKIDILVDLVGHSESNHRLQAIARRLAPVQVGWLGFSAWSGIDAIDHFLTDDVVTPRLPKFESERPHRLATGMQCFWPEPGSPDVNELPALQRGFVTFGVPHGLAKINPRVMRLWGRLLLTIPDSRLLLFREGLDAATIADIKRRFHDEAGVDPNRVECLGVCQETHGYHGYMSMYQQVDICLDTFPANAGPVSCESLWMGVPVLTMVGDRPGTRQTASILFRLGLQDWITRSEVEYLSKAIQLTSDLAPLAALRGEIRKRFRRTTVGDAVSFTRGFESSLRELWKNWCSRQR